VNFKEATHRKCFNSIISPCDVFTYCLDLIRRVRQSSNCLVALLANAGAAKAAEVAINNVAIRFLFMMRSDLLRFKGRSGWVLLLTASMKCSVYPYYRSIVPIVLN